MTSINALPDELLVHIFAELDLTDLPKLRLVCKRWNFIIADKSTWNRAFATTFGAKSYFPPIRANQTWMGEYYHRVKCLRLWSKARGTHVSYQLHNNDRRYIDYALADFESNGGYGRLMTVSRYYGSVSRCNLANGRNQGYVPWRGSMRAPTAVSVGWNWFVAGSDGELVIRNLNAVSTRGGATIVAKRESDFVVITSIDVTASPSVTKSGAEILVGLSSGTVELWSLSGVLITAIEGDEPVVHARSDFKTHIVIQTATRILLRKWETKEVVAQVQLPEPVAFEPGELLLHPPPLFYYGTRDGHVKNDFDVDFAGRNIVFSHNHHVMVYRYSEDCLSPVRVEINGKVVISKLQSTSQRRLTKYDASIPGGDALYYATVTDSNQIFVWNIRTPNTTKITPQCIINEPYFGKHHPEIPDMVGAITAVAVNAAVVVVGGYNGFFNVYDVFTGEIIKSEASVKYPRKYRHMFDELIPINAIILDGNDQTATHGVVVNGDTMQYFHFGEKLAVGPKPVKKRQAVREIPIAKQISDGIDEYDREVAAKREAEALLSKYNGDDFDEDEEMRIAMALSQSHQEDDLTRALAESSTNQDDSFARALAESSHQDDDLARALAASEIDDEDEELRRVLALSLVDN